MRVKDLLSTGLGLIAGALVWQAQGAPANTASNLSRASTPIAVPDLSGVWFRAWRVPQLFEPPDGGPGPVTGDPASPHIRGQNSPWIADLSSPILRPETRGRLTQLAEQQRAGHALLDNDTLCLPVGVLGSLNMFDAMQVLQTPDKVILLYARDHQMRVIYLDQPHSKDLAPTWYGESVGHYEGDTLVVDTIGMNSRTLVDRYGTPHSDQLHTIERYRRSADGTLDVSVIVEDPVTFTTAWSAKAAYKRDASTGFEEIVCAENNPAISDGTIRVPAATHPDF